jgi:hypothetical protein
MMSKPGPVMMAEPIMAQVPLALQFLFETTKDFAESDEAAACPRRRPRQGQRPPAQVAAWLAFTRVAAEHYDVSGEGGALLQSKAGYWFKAAVCAGHVMSTGRHAAEFTMVQAGTTVFVGLARSDIDVHIGKAYTRDKFWGLYKHNGALYHQQSHGREWIGQKSFGTGDVIGLLLDCDAGTLTVKKNGKQLGLVATGLTGEFWWAAALNLSSAISIRYIKIAAADERGW